MLSIKLQHRNIESTLFGIYNLCFLVLVILAAYFNEERIFGSDASSYLFGVVNNEWFYTERGRIIIWLSQWFPLLAVWLGVSMKGVLIAHSLGHILFFYFIFLVGHFHFRKPHIGVLMLLVQTLAVTEVYFAWPYGEVYYGVGLTVLLILILDDGCSLSYWSAFGIMVICTFLITGHPLVFPCLFLGVALLLANSGVARKHLFTAAVMLALILGRFMFFPSYDGQLATEFFSDMNRLTPSVSEVIGIARSYPLLWLLSAFVISVLIIRKEYLTVLLMMGAYVLVSLVIKRFAPLDGATQQYYQAYSGVLIIVLLVAVFREGIKGHVKTFLMILLVAVSMASVHKIYQFSGEVSFHVKKLKTMAQDLSEHEGHRFVITGKDFYGDESVIWQSSEPFHEMLLLSSLNQKTILLRVFERGMEYHELAISGHTPVEGPEAPRIKNKSYACTPENRALMEAWLHTVEPPLNEAYFPTDKSRVYRFVEN